MHKARKATGASEVIQPMTGSIVAAAAYSWSEEELRSMGDSEEDVDRDVEEYLRAIKSEAVALQGYVGFPSPDKVAWAAGVHDTAVWFAQMMAEDGEDFRYGVTVFAGRPGEEALVEALRKRAAWADARRAEAEEIADATRGLHEKERRRMKEREDLLLHLRRIEEEEDIIDAEDARILWSMCDKDPGRFLRYVSEATPVLAVGNVPSPEEVAAAARAEGEGMWLMQKMAGLVEKLRRGARVYTGRPCQETLLEALQKPCRVCGGAARVG